MVRPLDPSVHIARLTFALFLSWGALEAQAQVKIVAEPAELESFGTCLLTASQPGKAVAVWEWAVLTPDGGAFTRRGRSGPRNLYRAPRVDEPRTFRIGVRVQGSEGPWTEREVEVRPARATVGRVSLPSRQVAYEPVTLLSGRTSALLASLNGEGGAPGVWAWSILEPGGGAFTRLRTGPRNVYQAPFLLEKRTFHVAATGPGGARGLLPITVVPVPQRHPHANLLTGSVLGGSLGEGWSLPALTWVGAGLPPPWGAQAVCFVAGTEGGEGFWLMGDRQGIAKVNLQGALTRLALKGRYALEGPEDQACSGLGVEVLASAPPSSALGLPAVVAVVRAPDTCDRFGQCDWLGAQFLCAMALDGTLTPLAGRSLRRSGGRGLAYTGAAAEVDFRQVTGAALAPSGEVSVVDHANWNLHWFMGTAGLASGGARRLDRDGEVRSLVDPIDGLGELNARDNLGYPFLFKPLGLTVDPATGDLYTCEMSAIKRITPEGSAPILVGCPTVEGVPPPPGAPRRIRPITPCFNGPEALSFHQGALYIADRWNCAVQVYTPATQRLGLLVGAPGQFEPRPGPLATFAPELLPEECATLGAPRHFCMNAEGTAALVLLERGVVRVDLGWGETHAAGPEPELAAAP